MAFVQSHVRDPLYDVTQRPGLCVWPTGPATRYSDVRYVHLAAAVHVIENARNAWNVGPSVGNCRADSGRSVCTSVQPFRSVADLDVLT